MLEQAASALTSGSGTDRGSSTWQRVPPGRSPARGATEHGEGMGTLADTVFESRAAVKNHIHFLKGKTTWEMGALMISYFLYGQK